MKETLSLKTFKNLPDTKKEKIIMTAVREFGENGYGSASINTIVRNIGIAKGSIYQYFKDKQALFLYVFHYSMEKVKTYLKHVRQDTSDQTISKRLKKTLEAGVLFIEENPMIYRLYITILSDRTVPFRDELLIELRRHSLEFITGLLKTAKERGELKPDIDLSTAGFIIDAAMDRFLLNYIETRKNTARKNTTDDKADTDMPASLQLIDKIDSIICRGIINETHVQ